MRKLLTFLFLFSSLTKASVLFPLIECGEYRPDPDTAKLSFEFSSQSELSTDYKAFFEQVKHIPENEPQWLYELLDAATYKYKKVFPNPSKKDAEGKTYIETLIIQPSFAVRFNNVVVAGFNNGEFGAEIVKIEQNGKVSLIKSLNVEDVYRVNQGLLIVSGLAHMSFNEGMTYLLNDNMELQKYYGLVGAPTSSWKLSDGPILINSYKNGSQVLQSDGTLKRVTCG